MPRYVHCTFSNDFWSVPTLSKKTYEASTGATTVPIPLNACAMLILISEYFGGPQTTRHQYLFQFATIPPHQKHTCKIRVRRRLQRSKSISNHKSGRTKAAKRAVHQARPCKQSSDAKQRQTPDERSLVPPVSQDPIRMSQRRKRIRTKVRSLQSRRARPRNSQRVLKVLVQRINETIREALVRPNSSVLIITAFGAMSSRKRITHP